MSPSVSTTMTLSGVLVGKARSAMMASICFRVHRALAIPGGSTWPHRRQETRASMYGMSASTKAREADGGTPAKASWKDS
jgi:hypothetical protein